MLPSCVSQCIPGNINLGGALAVVVALVLVITRTKTLSDMTTVVIGNFSSIIQYFFLGYVSVLFVSAFFGLGLLSALLSLDERSECIAILSQCFILCSLYAVDQVVVGYLRNVWVLQKAIGVTKPYEAAPRIYSFGLFNCTAFATVYILCSLLSPYTPPHFLMSACVAMYVGDYFLQYFTEYLSSRNQSFGEFFHEFFSSLSSDRL